MMKKKVPGAVLLAAVWLASATPAIAQVEQVRLDIAGYLCGF